MEKQTPTWQSLLPNPLPRTAVPELLNFGSAEAVVRELRPNLPVHCLRPQPLLDAARWFLANFPGQVLYAVKCNPEPQTLNYLAQAGIRHFDIGSLTEIRAVRAVAPDARLHFMHPVKNRAAIREAYFTHGVRDFVLDCREELQKIIEATGAATDLNLHVRMSIPRGVAQHELVSKFGALPSLAVELLQSANAVAAKLGLCFHVGSQCLHPEAYRRGILLAAQIIQKAGVSIDILDIGGGFPAQYPGSTIPPLSRYMEAIKSAIAEIKLPATTELWCEPGRALVAEAGSLLVRVELRKGDALYINDGVYGSLFDAGILNTRYPAKLIRANGSEHKAPFKSFKLFGPTCDSIDVMRGPYVLPHDVVEGDWLEIGQLGAYCTSMRSQFNGLSGDSMTVEVWDEPQLRMPDYQPKTDRRVIRPDNVKNLNLLLQRREERETEMN
jgi:ornithine decarboxylase